MAGILLTRHELATLFILLSARQVIGVDPDALFPEDSDKLQAQFVSGLDSLRAKGLVTGEPAQAIPDHGLMELVSTITDPDFVVLANREEAVGVASAVHYLGSGDIASLEWSQAGDAYRVGWVADDEMLARRVLVFLRAAQPADGGTSFTIDEADFIRARDAARRGAEDVARAALPVALADTLGRAFAGNQGGELIVARPNAGQIEAGRRAWVLSGPAGAWIGYRLASDSATMHFEPLSVGSVQETIRLFVDFLKPVTA